MAALLKILTSVMGIRYSPQRTAALAVIRLSLGIAQMSMAVVSFILLITLGLQKPTIIMAALTTGLAMLSRRLFRGQRISERESSRQ
jgi:hypothetical protein